MLSGCLILLHCGSTKCSYHVSTIRKRCSARNADLPEELVHIWEPLLDRLSDTFDSFTTALVWHLLDVLLNAEATGEGQVSNEIIDGVRIMRTWEINRSHNSPR